MASPLRAVATFCGVLGTMVGAESECSGAECPLAGDDDQMSLLAKAHVRSQQPRQAVLAARKLAGKAEDVEGFPFLSQIRADWDSVKPVITGTWGGLDGPVDDKLFVDTITWKSAQEYFFVKPVSGDCDPADINLDALCSEIAYTSMQRKDLFNTYFSNDGNYGHSGRPGLVLRPSSWNTSATEGERINLKQGWFIDSWPDYRFVSKDPAKVPTNEERFEGLNYEPSGYRTTVNYDYAEVSGMLDPAGLAKGEALKVTTPPYLVGPTEGPGGTSFFSYQAPMDTATLEAFVEYYSTQQNFTIGSFECFTDGGKVSDPACNSGRNVNFFQGFIDLGSAGMTHGLERLAEFRKAYFAQKLYKNSPNGAPFGNEVEIDAYPWKTEPAEEQRTYGETYTSYMLPYGAVGAVSLMHGGPIWSLSTRPQPPHISARPVEWGADPEYYYLVKGSQVLYDGIVANLPDGAAAPEKLEVSNIWGTDFGGEELEAHIDAWISRPEGSAASDVFNPWVDFYADESEPHYEVTDVFLPLLGTTSASSFYRVKNVAKRMDARKMRVEKGYGVWAHACEKATGGVTLIASPGDDDLYGGLGDDRLEAHGATDRLTGGPGSDVFVVSTDSKQVIVTDLQVTDVLELQDCDSTADVSMSAKYWPGVLPAAGTPIYAFRGGDTYISIDLPGRPELVQLWRVDQRQLEIKAVRRGRHRVCQLKVKAMPPTPPTPTPPGAGL